MNREIKFRAWVKEEGVMMDVDEIYEDEYHFDEPIHWDEESGGYGWTRKKKDCILMQYTGINDKTGEMIYEGDICLDHGACGNKKFITDIRYMGNFILYSEYLEVVGNIYENPELFKKPTKG